MCLNSCKLQHFTLLELPWTAHKHAALVLGAYTAKDSMLHCIRQQVAEGDVLACH